ncbi:GNAT family N-acetyltransferase [Rothia halotolerans]|uniref:GNAT family N-acetyltransferase n=1 Tax=Rothia halotolerans TaxID=405770 RepID=UPI00101D12F6|nr:GNAT family N-acetyltransferase [Rothia halotolerans]
MTSPRLPLRTERLVLRPHRESDAAWMHRVCSRPDVARHLLDDPWTAAMAREKNAERRRRTDLDGSSGSLNLVVEHQGVPVGDVLLWFTDREHRVAEMGWVLDPAHGGRGLASEAVGAVLGLAFDHYGVHRVAAQMDARNLASARLARRVGMRQEAHLRQDWWSKGEWTDTLVFGMLAGDRG